MPATSPESLLRSFARYMKENPNVPEEQAITMFAAGNDRSESCVATGLQQIPKHSTVRDIRPRMG